MEWRINFHRTKTTFIVWFTKKFTFYLFRNLNCALTSFFSQIRYLSRWLTQVQSLSLPSVVDMESFQSLIKRLALTFHYKFTLSNCRFKKKNRHCLFFSRLSVLWQASVTVNGNEIKTPKLPQKMPGFSHKFPNLLIDF